MGEKVSVVGPKIFAMTARTTTRTIADIYGKGDLIRNFLKDDTFVDILHLGNNGRK